MAGADERAAKEPVATVVVAVADNGVIGDGEGMPWHLPADLRHVKAITMGKPLIMGRKTWRSIGRPLPGRTNIVVTRDRAFSAPGIVVVHDIAEALALGRRIALADGVDEVVVFGGAEIYRQTMNAVGRMHVTEVHLAAEGVTRFPDYDRSEWRETARVDHPAEGGAPAYSFVTLERIGAMPATPGIEVREMRAEDGEAVLAIYRQGIATGDATFESEAPDWPKFDAKYLQNCRFVAVLDGKVAGWATIGAVSARPVYRGVAEVSLYIADGARGKGVGRRLFERLIEESEKAGFWSLHASIFPENRASIELHRRFGFRILGIRERVAKMTYGPHAGRWRNTVIMERRSAVAGID